MYSTYLYNEEAFAQKKESAIVPQILFFTYVKIIYYILYFSCSYSTLMAYSIATDSKSIEVSCRRG